jgi:hypothetical protein
MTAFSDYRANDWDDRRLALAALLSVLLHGLIVLLVLLEPWTWRNQPDPPQIIAEFVMPEAPKVVPPPPAPPPVAQVPPPPAAQPEPVPPPAPPQLQRGRVAEESRAPPGAGTKAQTRERTVEPTRPARPPQTRDEAGRETAPALQQPRPQSQAQAGDRTPGATGGVNRKPGEMTQSESDFFLSQIVQAWVIDFDAPQFRDLVIEGNFRVLPNGMLDRPYGRDDPWDMRVMVRNWAQIEALRGPQAAAYRTAIESFMRAMRLVQPLKMPPNAAGYPKVLSLEFQIGDL